LGIINILWVYFFCFVFQRSLFIEICPRVAVEKFYVGQCFFLSIIFLKRAFAPQILRVLRRKKPKGFLRSRMTIIISETVGHCIYMRTGIVIVCSCSLIFTWFFTRTHFIYCLSFRLVISCPPPLLVGTF